jgi:hypothetical protein
MHEGIHYIYTMSLIEVGGMPTVPLDLWQIPRARIPLPPLSATHPTTPLFPAQERNIWLAIVNDHPVSEFRSN